MITVMPIKYPLVSINKEVTQYQMILEKSWYVVEPLEERGVTLRN